MTYLILLALAAALLGVVALYLGGEAGRTGLGRVTIAVALGTLMSVATLFAARFAGVASAVPVPLATRLIGWAIVAGGLVVVVGLVEAALSRLNPARGWGWLALALAAIVALVEAAVLVRLGTPMLWQLIDFGAVAAVAAFAWWAALPPAGPNKGESTYG